VATRPVSPLINQSTQLSANHALIANQPPPLDAVNTTESDNVGTQNGPSDVALLVNSLNYWGTPLLFTLAFQVK
jgi:hypothetical protein